MKCRMCGKEFEPGDGHRFLCSDACVQQSYLVKNRKYQKDRRARIHEEKMTEKVCRHCGKIFVSSNNKKVFCSKECQLAAKREAERAKAKARHDEIRHCPVCGAAFNGVMNKRYCSKACGDIAYRREHKEDRRAYVERLRKSREIVKRCAFCGREFTTTDSRQKFCSRACTRSFNSHGTSLRTAASCGEMTAKQKAQVESDMRISDPVERYEKSLSWTKAMRRYAMRLYTEQNTMRTVVVNEVM